MSLVMRSLQADGAILKIAETNSNEQKLHLFECTLIIHICIFTGRKNTPSANTCYTGHSSTPGSRRFSSSSCFFLWVLLRQEFGVHYHLVGWQVQKPVKVVGYP